MVIKNFLNLRIGEIADPTETISESVDIVNLTSENSSFGFVRPTKIAWRAHLDRYPDILSFVQSKQLMKRLRRWDQDAQPLGIKARHTTELTEVEFKEILSLYEALMTEKDDKANTILTKDWHQDKLNQGKKVGATLIYWIDKLIAANLFTVTDEKLSVGYGATASIKLEKWNLGAYVDFKTLEFAKSIGYNTVSFGQDTNLYGHHLNPGLFSYKARLGLTPEPAKKADWITTKFVSFEAFGDEIVFLGKDKDMVITYLLSRKDQPDPHAYIARGVEEVRLISMEDVHELFA